MNRVPDIVRNPAYIGELEPEGDEVDPVDLSPFIEGDTPIITGPTSEDEGVDRVEDAIRELEELVQDSEDDQEENAPQILREAIQNREGLNQELRSILSLRDTSSAEHTDVPEVDVWDTGKATEQEYRLHPDSTMEEIRDRLANQVWDLLQVLQERVDQHTYDSKDIEFISGLHNILVLNCRLRIMTELELNCHAV